MRKLRPTHFIRLAVLSFAIALAPLDAMAQDIKRGASGLPLPRYVSLKADKVNMRIGPGIDYRIAWRYLRAGVPMEIIQEYDNWRKVRDFEGAEGWIHQALLSGDRTAIAAPWMRDRADAPLVTMYRTKATHGAVTARLTPGVIVKVQNCDGTWCEADVQDRHGFVAQQELWGAYPGEAFQ